MITHESEIAFALEILDRKGVFEEHTERWIEGVATTPHQNSNGITIEPRGCVFTKEDRVPLLLDHDVTRPIGLVRSTHVAKNALRFKAQIATGRLAWLPDVWTDIQSSTLACVSPGVVNLRKGTSDYHEWVFNELSVCKRGANLYARIDRVREIKNARCILPNAPNPRQEITIWDVRSMAA
jgi:hypothetical protein